LECTNKLFLNGIVAAAHKKAVVLNRYDEGSQCNAPDLPRFHKNDFTCYCIHVVNKRIVPLSIQGKAGLHFIRLIYA